MEETTEKGGLQQPRTRDDGTGEPDWGRIEELFHGALERSSAERQDYLDDACGGDARLRSRVESLLRADSTDAEKIEGAIRGTFDLAAESSLKEDRQRIGPYRVLGELGRGGMSTVYLAERDDEHYRKRVAVKVVKRGMDTRDILRRLRQERQILAHLEHPNIARLLDGGNTEDGLPYFVMEHVEGEPVVGYCDTAGLGVEARLRLFLEVCGAVSHAHRNLVIHRDLKPSNILVDSAGGPRLLDFGIAKLLDPAALDSAPFAAPLPTATGVRFLTPEYASPEQVRGEPLTTATDIYSLGVLLYELLTGERPYRVDRRSQKALEEAICERRPERPSTVAGAGRSGGGPPVRADRLRRRLQGDLDNIVSKALRKEPARRYASVEGFAEDIRRHLAGHPVAARPDTWAYRTRKFLRRHRLAAASAAAVTLLVAGLVTFYTLRLATERDRARLEERKSTQVAAFLGQLFERADPSHALGEEITARELLAQGALRIRNELAEEPAVRADLMDLMGRIHLNLGLYDEAESLLTASEAVRRELYDGGHPEVAASVYSRALRYHAQGLYPEAEAAYQEALELRRRLPEGGGPEVAESLTGLANLLYDRGDHEAAEEMFREALGIRLSLYGRRHPEVATSLNDLGAALYGKGDDEGAEALLREALSLRRAVLGAVHPDVAVSLNSLAAVVHARGGVEEAEGLFRESIEVRRKLYTDRHPLVADALNNLGELLRRKGDAVSAESLYREALDIIRASQGEDHPNFAATTGNLAACMRALGRFGEAEALYLPGPGSDPESPGPGAFPHPLPLAFPGRDPTLPGPAGSSRRGVPCGPARPGTPLPGGRPPPGRTALGDRPSTHGPGTTGRGGALLPALPRGDPGEPARTLDGSRGGRLARRQPGQARPPSRSGGLAHGGLRAARRGTRSRRPRDSAVRRASGGAPGRDRSLIRPRRVPLRSRHRIERSDQGRSSSSEQ